MKFRKVKGELATFHHPHLIHYMPGSFIIRITSTQHVFADPDSDFCSRCHVRFSRLERVLFCLQMFAVQVVHAGSLQLQRAEVSQPLNQPGGGIHKESAAGGLHAGSSTTLFDRVDRQPVPHERSTTEVLCIMYC
jgi:hypothetical protein